MTEPIVIYGSADCDDTARACERLRARGIPFREVDIDRDGVAEQFVIFINGGFRSTLTLVIGAGRRRTLLVEPTDAELDALAA